MSTVAELMHQGGCGMWQTVGQEADVEHVLELRQGTKDTTSGPIEQNLVTFSTTLRCRSPLTGW